ncbi:hypothetical protein ABZU22_04560 [Micromonospora sp. NPDC005222]|uniref:hypothetical protein n=1 Tax=unclassified Micromonospora TaxID=2617518 RepID=UPI0033ACEB45
MSTLPEPCVAVPAGSGAERLVADESETQVWSDEASPGKPTNGVDHLALADVLDVPHENIQFAEELSHLGGREFQQPAGIDAVQHRSPAVVLRALKHGSEPEVRVTYYSYFKIPSVARARTQLFDPDQLNVYAQAENASNGT